MSRALDTWNSLQLQRLSHLEAAHAAVGGTKRGRRYTTTQVNHALVVAIAAQFQGFCRNLHSEGVNVLAAEIEDEELRAIVAAGMTGNRALDRSNANEDAIAKDFERIGIDIWADAAIVNPGLTPRRKEALKMLLMWRNAIAHQDFNPEKLGGRTEARLREAKGWLAACAGLACIFDRVVGDHLAAITGNRPWE